MKLVLVGGGHANTLVLLGLYQEKSLEITLISDGKYSFYSGMVPGVISGQYLLGQSRIDLEFLSEKYKYRFIPYKVLRISAEFKKVYLENGEIVEYDLLSINVGSTSNDCEVLGVDEFAVKTRPLGELLRKVEGLEEVFSVVVVGGGVAGVELAFAMRARFKSSRVLIVYRGEVVEELNASARKAVLEALHKAEIQFLNGEVQEITGKSVILADSTEIPCDCPVWATGAKAISIETDLAKCPNGYFLTNQYLQGTNSPFVFAAGDCITISSIPHLLPKAGVFAVRESEILIKNLKKMGKILTKNCKNCQLAEYLPQHDFLRLINLCNGRAIGAKWNRSYEGKLAWKLKNRIDTQFMQKFQ